MTSMMNTVPGANQRSAEVNVVTKKYIRTICPKCHTYQDDYETHKRFHKIKEERYRKFNNENR